MAAWAAREDAKEAGNALASSEPEETEQEMLERTRARVQDEKNREAQRKRDDETHAADWVASVTSESGESPDDFGDPD
ncbi:hypothetical protein HYV73_02680 [Candidatus Uhrbacteria bacterium]|nr:hypothetical protein [Candidatus Uhrbacteria bacterium]